MSVFTHADFTRRPTMATALEERLCGKRFKDISVDTCCYICRGFVKQLPIHVLGQSRHSAGVLHCHCQVPSRQAFTRMPIWRWWIWQYSSHQRRAELAKARQGRLFDSQDHAIGSRLLVVDRYIHVLLAWQKRNLASPVLHTNARSIVQAEACPMLSYLDLFDWASIAFTHIGLP